MKKNTLLTAAVLALLLVLPAAGMTLKGTASQTKTPTFGLEKVGTGQTIVTVMWSKKSADLDLVIECDGFVTGQSISGEDRHELLTVGMADGQICTLAVVSFKGKSKFWLNIQASETGSLGAAQMRVAELSLADVPALEAAVGRLKAQKARIRARR